MSGHNLAKHWQHGRKQAKGSSHEDIVLSSVRSLSLPTLMSVKQSVIGSTYSALARTCNALLRWLVFKLFMCLFLQQKNKWRQSNYLKK